MRRAWIRVMAVTWLCLLGCRGSDGGTDAISTGDAWPDAGVGDLGIEATETAGEMGDAEADTEGGATVVVLPESPLAPDIFSEDLPTGTEGIAVTSEGMVYLSGGTLNEGFVYELSASGERVRTIPLLPVEAGKNAGCAGVALTPEGDLLVCRFGAGRIERVQLKGEPEVDVFAEDIATPNTLLFIGDTLYYSSSQPDQDLGGHIGRIRDGEAPEVLLDGITYANGLAADLSASFLYFTSSKPGSLQRAALLEDGTLGVAGVVSEDPLLSVADGLLVVGEDTVFIAGFAAGKLLAWSEEELRVVAEGSSGDMMGIASLGWVLDHKAAQGRVLATNLLKPKVFEILLQVESGPAVSDGGR